MRRPLARGRRATTLAGCWYNGRMSRNPGLTRRSLLHFAVTFAVTASILLTALVLTVSADGISRDHALLRTVEVDATVVDRDEYEGRCGSRGRSTVWWWTVEWTHPGGERVRGRLRLCNAERLGGTTSAWVGPADQEAALAGETPDVSSFSMRLPYLLGVGVSTVYGLLVVALYAWAADRFPKRSHHGGRLRWVRGPLARFTGNRRANRAG